MNHDLLPKVRAALAALQQQVNLTVDLEAVAARVALVPDADSARLEDLCLATACLASDDRAANFLIERYSPAMRMVVRRSCVSLAEADDIVQDVLVKVLVGWPPAPPALASYRGQGALQAWLSVVAARASVDLVRRPQAITLADTIMSSITPAAPATTHVHDRLKQDFKQAVSLALAHLDETDRQILRLHLAGLVAEQIGLSMGLHRVSVARRLSAIRTKIRDNALTQLGSQAEVIANDISQFSVSFERLLTPRDTDT